MQKKCRSSFQYIRKKMAAVPRSKKNSVRYIRTKEVSQTCGKLAGIISDKGCNLLTKSALRRRLRPVTSVNQCKGLAKFSIPYGYIRNAEVRGSIPLCSTNNSPVSSKLQLHQNSAEKSLDVILT